MDQRRKGASEDGDGPSGWWSLTGAKQQAWGRRFRRVQESKTDGTPTWTPTAFQWAMSQAVKRTPREQKVPHARPLAEPEPSRAC